MDLIVAPRDFLSYKSRPHVSSKLRNLMKQAVNTLTHKAKPLLALKVPPQHQTSRRLAKCRQRCIELKLTFNQAKRAFQCNRKRLEKGVSLADHQ